MDEPASISNESAATLTARFSALALALSGYPLRIAPAKAGELSYTDGETIFLNGSTRDPYAEIAVQCRLLSGGSLARGAMVALLGQGARTRRYLALEARRLLGSPDMLTAFVLQGRVAVDPPESADSAASLALSGERRRAEARDPLLGMIRPARLLARNAPFARGPARPEDIRQPNPQSEDDLEEIDDDDESDDLPTVLKKLSTPLNIPNPFSRFFNQALGNRRAAGSEEPGMEVPTTSVRQSRAASLHGARAQYQIEADLPDLGLPLADRWLYPEWDMLKRAYRPAWCSVREVPFSRITDRAERAPFRRDLHLESGLRRLALGMARAHRQVEGDDLDLDAVVAFAVRHEVDRRRGTMNEAEPAIYGARRRIRHDLGVMLVLDISGSVAEKDRSGESILAEQIRAGSALLHGLTAVGNRTAALAFHSHGRDAGRAVVLKSFEDRTADRAVGHMGEVKPSGYTRLGAGIRHAAMRLADGAGTARKLMIVISDGVPYDLNYSGRFGVEDVIRALEEREEAGQRVLWIGIGTMATELERYLADSVHQHVSAASYAALRNALPHHVATAVLGKSMRRAA
jgi:Mg-chelatase subunit ChlD